MTFIAYQDIRVSVGRISAYQGIRELIKNILMSSISEYQKISGKQISITDYQAINKKHTNE